MILGHAGTKASRGLLPFLSNTLKALQPPIVALRYLVIREIFSHLLWAPSFLSSRIAFKSSRLPLAFRFERSPNGYPPVVVLPPGNYQTCVYFFPLFFSQLFTFRLPPNPLFPHFFIFLATISTQR